ncbi:hypothetical protein GYA49_01950 [Candidatus Beckwithbacteria bacterium]|nr:hypothetical protein [Candidatus Beckwithbacteria bacterium]
MKIYFSASISDKKNLINNYKFIYKTLEEIGVEIISDHVLKDTAETIKLKSHEEVVLFYKKIVKLINSSDIVIIESSASSTNLGHEISLALEKNKPTIVLVEEQAKTPRLLEGSNDEKLIMVRYQMNTLRRELKFALEEAKSQSDVRFNFFVSPKIVNYLDWIAKKKKVPRAVYLRRLIDEDMNKNKEFLNEE